MSVYSGVIENMKKSGAEEFCNGCSLAIYPEQGRRRVHGEVYCEPCFRHKYTSQKIVLLAAESACFDKRITA